MDPCCNLNTNIVLIVIILPHFQHYLIMFGATVANPLVLAKHLCVGDDNVAKSEIIGTIFFVSGICTLLQTIIGIRSGFTLFKF